MQGFARSMWAWGRTVRWASAVWAWLGLATFVLPAQGLESGQIAPLFELADLSGKPVRLRELRGKVVLVNFWASWCGPCREELPVYEKLARRYQDRGLVIVGVNIDKSAQVAREFLQARKLDLSFAVVNDGDHRVAASYAPPTMPSSYFIDRSGLVRHIHAGFRTADAADIEAKIKLLLD
jgi:peroxiredoxin